MMKKIVLIAASVLLVGVSSSAFEWEWKRIPVDADITGVKSPSADNVEEALGVVSKGNYFSPSLKVYSGGCVRKVAALMIEAQPSMAAVKEVIGYSETGMNRGKRYDCSLYNMIGDCLLEGLSDSLGVDIDVFFYNFGGVRTDIPRGNIVLDDIVSMLPFKNWLIVVDLRGEDLEAIFKQIASEPMLFYSGARMAAKDGKVKTLEVGGKKISPLATYKVGLNDFILNGGDGFSIGRNALHTDTTKYLPIDIFLPYIKSFAAKGLPVSYKDDGRAIYE